MSLKYRVFKTRFHKVKVIQAAHFRSTCCLLLFLILFFGKKTMTLGFRPALYELAAEIGFSRNYMAGILLNNNGIWKRAREYFEDVLERMLLYVIDWAQRGNRDPEMPDLRIITNRILRTVSTKIL